MTNNQIILDELLEGVIPADDLHFEHIESRYRNVQIIFTALGYLALAISALFLLMLDGVIWCIIAECVILIAAVINMVILRKAWEFKGYALRECDITYRGGIVFPKTTTIPYICMQQVSVKQNPISKMFRLYAVEIVNGAQAMSALTIPGLTEDRANQIKNIVIGKMKNDNE